MKDSIRREFGDKKPVAIVLDDHADARTMTVRKLRERGFSVIECSNVEAFDHSWYPGSADVIVSDWQLSHLAAEGGDKVLQRVRQRDWDVPFVLVSGKLDEAGEAAPVLESLLVSGSARFVRRGSEGITEACDVAEAMLERRDLALLKMVVALRDAASENRHIRTSSGEVSARQMLADLVSKPEISHEAGSPLASARAGRVGGLRDNDC